MAAPSGIVWGSEVNGYGRIGIYTSLSTTNTTVTATVQVWFWSKYSVSDTANTLYYTNAASSSSATDSVGSVSISAKDNSSGWSTANQVKLYEYTHSAYTRGTSAVTRYLYAKLINVDRVGGTMYASTTVTIPALPTYTISYNANGGSGAPSSQTKWYGTALTLSSTKPSRTGYTFQGWATSSSGSVAYASGASYTANANVTLYAVWEAVTYTVSYNMNGGSGTIANQTKTYGVTLTLSSTKPTRTNYTFMGWGTSASATTVSYAAGASYTNNATITLYAIWKLAYVVPRIYNVSVERCDSNGTLTDEGTKAKVVFDWEADKTVTSVTFEYKLPSASSWSSETITASGTSGTISYTTTTSAFNTEYSYDYRITVTDSGGSASITGTLSSMRFAVDFLTGGTGVAFGKTAELDNVAEFDFDVVFNKAVYGNVHGLEKVTEIPANSNFNDYKNTGVYAVYMTTTAATISNIPQAIAGRLEVSTSTGDGWRSSSWLNIRQKFIPYLNTAPIWERMLTRDDSNTWTYSSWHRTTLTPTISEQLYSDAFNDVMGLNTDKINALVNHTQHTLWSGAYYMQASHTIALSEAITAQPNGIVLVFSKYESGAAQDSAFNSFFVSKKEYELNPTSSRVFIMADGNGYKVGVKKLKFTDTTVTGDDSNTFAGAASSNITIDNKYFVLRYVIGV